MTQAERHIHAVAAASEGGRPTAAIDRTRLVAELDRVDVLIRCLERHREGKNVGEALRRDLAQAQAAVTQARQGDGLVSLPVQLPIEVHMLAYDCLMVLAYPVLRPSRARRVQGLASMPQQGETPLTQALVHELLMPDDQVEQQLSQLLAPGGVLAAQGLIRSEGEGPHRSLRAGRALIRALSGTEQILSPPEGVRRVFSPGDALPDLFLNEKTQRRLAEIVTLATLVDRKETQLAGPSVLFTGGPGTGKSLAVRHMAERLNKPLYQIDLGRVLSKWIGETERNLSRIFSEMSGTDGCILIDEADALLGKRVEVKESRDQHANVTVSHLLSVLEMHRGPVFLTSNLRGNLDGAYIRRFAAIVDFQRPGEALRARIWKRALGQSAIADPDRLVSLAAPTDLSAAEITNCAGMVLALARTGGRSQPDARDLARAIMLEKMKTGMTFARNDLGPLAEYWEGV